MLNSSPRFSDQYHVVIIRRNGKRLEVSGVLRLKVIEQP